MLTRPKEEYYNIVRWQLKHKEKEMEKRAIEKKCGEVWNSISMSDLSQGDEWRYADEERSYVASSEPFLSTNEHNEEVWTVEVQDD